ncbi:MAG: bifunctional riboflavin kinase/FAD synthetase [Phenylobacterium sp.]|uniref:bifunctional riboflavin kinase/FAD synthetase n=1 Tax=Phenylobacterium sp. TaxID=1871053 RepID=UPI0027326B09|nr:bifunctional riboflavin kinase/FAD synthetase [Phenylobacterium sp.]MDP3174075.1 bifunctional riboflavin kinase/FAD synthetase [Phenylobacterium sp.]
MNGVRVIRRWRDLPAADRGAAVAFGNFDGVHRGHQQVINDAKRAAETLGAPLGVISFDPHPRRIYQPDAPSFRLMKAEQQARVLAEMGVERLYLLPFDVQIGDMTDREFATKVLSAGLGVRHVAVGFDITFGKGRTGSPELMAEYGAELGFSVSAAEAVGDDGEKYSSTAVRAALREGRTDIAADILGRPFAIQGEVQRGRQLGRKFGYPTANVALDDYVRPRFGVYATRTRLPDGRWQAGVANLGVNPTVGEVAPVLETWLFDFDEDLYGQILETQLIAFLRPEEKFADVEIMNRQVMADAARAREILKVG